jgi:hypothetical protein
MRSSPGFRSSLPLHARAIHGLSPTWAITVRSKSLLNKMLAKSFYAAQSAGSRHFA